MAHRIGGRKLSRKQGPRLSLFKNLTVSVIRYERVKTTEAKAKEISGRVGLRSWHGTVAVALRYWTRPRAAATLV